jgi:hypothetical protein
MTRRTIQGGVGAAESAGTVPEEPKENLDILSDILALDSDLVSWGLLFATSVHECIPVKAHSTSRVIIFILQCCLVLLSQWAHLSCAEYGSAARGAGGASDEEGQDDDEFRRLGRPAPNRTRHASNGGITTMPARPLSGPGSRGPRKALSLGDGTAGLGYGSRLLAAGQLPVSGIPIVSALDKVPPRR